MHVAPTLFQADQVQPFRFLQHLDIETLLPPFGYLLQLHGRFAVRFERPAFFADNQHRGLLTGAVRG